VAKVDVVEGVGGFNSIVLGVVDHELDVWRQPCGLDGAQVDTGDFGAGMLVGH